MSEHDHLIKKLYMAAARLDTVYQGSQVGEIYNPKLPIRPKRTKKPVKI